MLNFKHIYKYLTILLTLMLVSCGDNDGNKSKLTKGHRDAIKIQCEDSSNKEACNLEVRANFASDGNDWADFSELTKDQIESVKWNCNRSRKYGLVAYNECLEKFIIKAEGGDLFKKDLAEKKPKNNIERLEHSTVYIEMAYFNKKLNKELTFSSGSGVIISEKDIITNCHVAMADDLDRLKKTGWKNENVEKKIWIKTINGKDWAEAKLRKKNVKKDICLVRHSPAEQFSIKMSPITKFGSFDKIKKGQFVRAMGSPEGLIGYTSEGSVQWIGTAENAGKFSSAIKEGYDQDTKLIIHGARIAPGSSGGPLFDNDGNIIGINTLGFEGTAAEYIAISADHIKDLLYND